MDYNLISFGEELRRKRVKLGFTLEYVSYLSGINPRTISRIEYGKVIPKIETLEFLSFIYKDDINSMFLYHRLDDYLLFYEIRDRLEGKVDGNELSSVNIELNELKEYIKYVDNIFYKRLIQQLILFINAIIVYEIDDDYTTSFDMFIKSMEATTPTFSIDSYKSFVYSTMEIRILMNISFVLNDLGYKEKYKHLMEFCINSIEPSEHIYPRLCHNLAGVYRRDELYKESLKFSNKGIDSCRKIKNFNILSTLYYGKGISEYKLNNDQYIKTLEKSIILCEAFGQIILKEKIIKNCKEFFDIII